MERNDANDFGAANTTGASNDAATGGSASGGTASGFGGTTGGFADTSGGSYGTPTNTSIGAGYGAAGSDPLRGNAQSAKERLGHAGERAREVKRSVEQTLADRLEAGARSLRQRTAPGTSTPAYAAAGGATAAGTSDAQLDQLQGNVVKGMEATADWLRNGDLKETVEEQARTNPGRTLLVALGVGYLLGKAFRR